MDEEKCPRCGHIDGLQYFQWPETESRYDWKAQRFVTFETGVMIVCQYCGRCGWYTLSSVNIDAARKERLEKQMATLRGLMQQGNAPKK